MLKKSVYIFLVFLLILFFFQNSDRVPIAFLATKTHFRVIFLMLTCLAFGFIWGYYYVFKKEESLRKEIKRLKNLLDREKERNRFEDA